MKRIGYACPVCEAHRKAVIKDGEYISWIHCKPCWAALPPKPESYTTECVNCLKDIWGHPDRGFIHEWCGLGEPDDRKCHHSSDGKHHES